MEDRSEFLEQNEHFNFQAGLIRGRMSARPAGQDESKEPTILIRGLKTAQYHKDAARPTMQLLREAGEKPKITGGGRIKHSSKSQSIFIYG